MDNLTITIGAATGQLRADLALAQSEMRATAREMNALANAARRSGDELALGKLGQAAAAYEQVAAQVAALKTEMNEGARASEALFARFQLMPGVFGRVRENLGGLREGLEAVGALIVVEKLREFAHGMAELGERTANAAWVVGTSVQQYAQFAGALELAGGDAETAQRTIERLARSVQQALTNPNSQAAASFRNLGISMEEVRRHANDLPGLFALLVEKVNQLDPGLQRTGELHEVLGRGMDRLVPAFRGGATEWEELNKRAVAYAVSLKENEPAMLRASDDFHALAQDARKLAIDGFGFIEPVLHYVTGLFDSVTRSIDNMIGTMQAFLAMADAAMGWVERELGLPDLSNGPESPYTGHLRTRPVGTEKAGGRGAKGKTADEIAAEDQRELERELNEETEHRIILLDNERRISELARKDRATHLDALRQLGAISAEDELKQKLDVLNTQRIADENYFSQKLGFYQKDSIQYDRVLGEQALAAQRYRDDVIALTDKTAEQMTRTAKAWAEPFKQAFAEVGRSIEEALKKLVLPHTRQQGRQAIAQLYSGLTGAGINFAEGIGSRGAAALLGAKGGQGIGEFLGDKALSLLGLGNAGKEAAEAANTLAINALTAALTANTAALGTAAAASTAAAGTSATGSVAGGGLSALSFLGKVGSWAASILPFSHGGIVPAAAGGWALPSSFGSDRVLAALTPGETVLPTKYTAVLDRLASGNSGDSGTPDIHLHFSGPADGPSIDRWFKDNMYANADVLRRIFRNGAVSPRTI